jgi:hypothetical protein
MILIGIGVLAWFTIMGVIIAFMMGAHVDDDDL